ncbi:MAG: single-stranded-DNA-specific exonuclease RecJ [Christensenellaceae bacterium]|nr:single-stranded-DNA-specific exonuclease RecJ [Christensenellaceae bacterium]
MQFIKRGAETDRRKAEELAKELGMNPVMGELLMMRGIETKQAAQKYFSSDELLDPFAFRMMEESVALIEEMIEAGVPIAVYSDYDCDGVCGAAIMYLVLKKLGAEVVVYFPDRFTEGYGTNARAIEMLADEAGLIITVDCGIRSVDDVALARDLGAEVIILDHHECEELPDTPYILNPKCPGETYPNKNLCGAGIAFKVACALMGEDAYRLADLAGVATIGDLVSLTGENRTIAAMGIKQLKEQPNPGLKALLIEAGIDQEKVDSQSVSFGIVPRINAAGRLEHAVRAFDLLTTSSRVERAECARHIQELNDRRKTIQNNISVLAQEQVQSTEDRIILIKGEGFHKGVVGLAASRIAEHYYRPAIVLSEEDGMLTGSARSIDGVNIYEIMNTMSHLYTRFGGHSQAAGVTFPAEYFEEVCEGLNHAAETLDASLFCRKKYYDTELDPANADLALADDILRLEPFGLDNPPPVFLIRGEKVSNVSKMGKNREHSRGRIGKVPCVRFGGSLIEGVDYSMLGELLVNEYNGIRNPQFRISAAQPVRAGLTEEAELSLLRSFPAEIKQLAARTELADNSAQFFEKLEAAVNGEGKVLILVGSVPGMQFTDMLPEELPMIFRDSADAESRILVGAKPVGEYTHVFKIGAFSSDTAGEELMTDSLISAYRSEAGEYFADRRELTDYREAFRAETGSFESVSQLLKAVCRRMKNGTIKKAWFSMNIFFEQKLIALSKGDRISLIFREQAAAESKLYDLFESFLNGEQYV